MISKSTVITVYLLEYTYGLHTYFISGRHMVSNVLVNIGSGNDFSLTVPQPHCTEHVITYPWCEFRIGTFW